MLELALQEYPRIASMVMRLVCLRTLAAVANVASSDESRLREEREGENVA